MTLILIILMLFSLPAIAQETDSIAVVDSIPSGSKEVPIGKPCVVIENPLIPRSSKRVSAWRELSYVPLPLFATSFIVRTRKEDIQAAAQNFHAGYENSWDNYIQYSPFALTVALKACGVENHSKWGRFLASSAMSYAMMAILTNGIKYTVREQRPDASTLNSFPSGHTATVFASATILHKEYGLTRSLWYSVAGYAIATTTGIMRVLNNRHWASDVFAGAAVGIVSVDMGYFFSDLIFKDKHIIRPYKEMTTDFYESPSFFNINAGFGMLRHNFNFSNYHLTSNLPIVTQAELAYYFNQNFGIGARLSVSSPVLTDGTNFDTMGMFSLHLGSYFTIPLMSRLAVGGKVLLGRTATSSFTLGNELSCDKASAFAFGLGTNIAYAYRNNMAWRFNVDYDYTCPQFKFHTQHELPAFHNALNQLTLSCSMSVMF